MRFGGTLSRFSGFELSQRSGERRMMESVVFQFIFDFYVLSGGESSSTFR